MEITIMTSDDEQIFTFNVNPSITVEDLKAMVEVETRIPLKQQQMLFDAKEMRNSKKLRKYGVSDGDLVVMKTVSPSSDQLGFNPDGSAVNPWAFRQHILNDHDMMARIHMNDPELAAKILGRESGDDLDWLQLLLRTRHSQRSELQRQQDEELALLWADQSDPEVRRKIGAAIPHNGVVEEWDADVEHIGRYIPEQDSPYVEVEVNGKPLKALVDTGAMMSTMTESCAEDCGLSKLINRSEIQRITGLGELKTVGQINIAPIKIGNMFCLITFSVFDESFKEPCILGMDVLRKNQCIVDTKANVLRIRGGVDVPFVKR